MTKDEKIYELTRALEAIAGYSNITDSEWRIHYPELAKDFQYDATKANALSNFAFSELKRINEYRWTYENQ